jgi:hypothetical protein
VTIHQRYRACSIWSTPQDAPTEGVGYSYKVVIVFMRGGALRQVSHSHQGGLFARPEEAQREGLRWATTAIDSSFCAEY